MKSSGLGQILKLNQAWVAFHMFISGPKDLKGGVRLFYLVVLMQGSCGVLILLFKIENGGSKLPRSATQSDLDTLLSAETEDSSFIF